MTGITALARRSAADEVAAALRARIVNGEIVDGGDLREAAVAVLALLEDDARSGV